MRTGLDDRFDRECRGAPRRLVHRLVAVSAAVLCSGVLAACGEPPLAPAPSFGGSGDPTRDAAAAAGTTDFFRRGGTATSSSLDVDGDGLVTPQTDALLIMRFVSGFRGGSLVEGAVAPGCTRCSAEQIAAYLESL